MVLRCQPSSSIAWAGMQRTPSQMLTGSQVQPASNINPHGGLKGCPLTSIWDYSDGQSEFQSSSWDWFAGDFSLCSHQLLFPSQMLVLRRLLSKASHASLYLGGLPLGTPKLVQLNSHTTGNKTKAERCEQYVLCLAERKGVGRIPRSSECWDVVWYQTD